MLESGLWYLRIFPHFRISFTNLSLSQNILERRVQKPPRKERSTCSLYCVQTSSFLWGCGESVNPPKLNIQEVHDQGALSSRPKGDPGPLPIFQNFFTFVKSHPSPVWMNTNQIWMYFHYMYFLVDETRKHLHMLVSVHVHMYIVQYIHVLYVLSWYCKLLSVFYHQKCNSCVPFSSALAKSLVRINNVHYVQSDKKSKEMIINCMDCLHVHKNKAREQK